MTQPPYPGDPGQSYPPQPGWSGQAGQSQPGQQPGQSWGQQPQQPQQPQQAGAQGWGQQAQPQQSGQQSWGQQQATPQSSWANASSGYSSGSTSTGAGGFDPATSWPLIATAASALLAFIFVLAMSWVSDTVTLAGHTHSSGAKPMTGDLNKAWPILIIVLAIVTIGAAGARMFVKQTALLFATVGGAVLTLVLVIVEMLYLNSKLPSKKAITADLQSMGGGKESVGFGMGAWITLVLAVLAVVFAVLALMRLRDETGASASVGGYGSSQQSSFGTQSAWQQAGSQVPQQAGQVPQQGGQQGWGQRPQQQPQGGQQGWGQQPQQQPQQPQQGGQQAWGQQPQQPQQGGQQGWGQQPQQGGQQGWGQ